MGGALGGEEFLIVLPETGFQGAMFVAEKIRAIMTSVPFVTRDGDVVATSSFGVASTELHGPDLAMKSETLIRAADQCLYTSKQSGRNRATGRRDPDRARAIGARLKRLSRGAQLRVDRAQILLQLAHQAVDLPQGFRARGVLQVRGGDAQAMARECWRSRL